MAKPEEFSISVRLVSEDAGDMYEARVAELPDVCVFSESYGSAYLETIEVIKQLQETYEKKGKVFPLPEVRTEEEFSGRVTLRMSKSLHAAVHGRASRDGISLNQWIVEAVASRVDGKTVATNSVFIAHMVVNQQSISMRVQPTSYVGSLGVEGGLFIANPSGLGFTSYMPKVGDDLGQEREGA